jgi:hypothetical protein
METLQEYYDRHAAYLSDDISSIFVNGLLPIKMLPEFVYGLDHMHEITESEHFKSNRILETHDTYSVRTEANRVFNKCKLHKNDFTWKIKSVGPVTWAAIGEFLKQDYLNVFFRVMHAVGNNQLEFTLDGRKCKLRLEIKTPHPMFAVFEYVDVTEHKVLKLPFFLNRLGKSLQAAGARRSVIQMAGAI